jgi:hypothetical protein
MQYRATSHPEQLADHVVSHDHVAAQHGQKTDQNDDSHDTGLGPLGLSSLNLTD